MFKDLPFDLRTVFDNELKEVPVYPLQIKGALLYVRARLEHLPLPESLKWRYLTQKAQLLKLNQAYAEAAKIVENQLHNPEPPQRLIAYRIRLGNIYHLDKRFSESNALFERLLDDYNHWSVALQNTYGHFLWQHAGKNAFDQKRYAAAQTFFEQALNARQQQNLSQELIESSQLALKAVSFA